MLNIVVGGVLALVLMGLPLAIIGLFVASVLDQRNAKPDQSRKASPVSTAFAAEADRGGRNRRRIIYGQHPVIAKASNDRLKMARTAELQGRQ